MSGIQIDRIDGLSSSTAIKGPCRVATTTDIPVLSGLMTINGVSLAVEDRVLVKDQASPIENGIYVVDTGPWRRSRDFSSNRDIRKGTHVWVTDGEVDGGADYVLTTANPVVIGTSDIDFVLAEYPLLAEVEEIQAAVLAGLAALSSISVLSFATKAAATAYAPPVAPLFIRIEGYGAAGDGGGALYKKVASQPSHNGKLSITQTTGPLVVWYEIAEPRLSPAMFSASPLTTAIQSALDVQKVRGGGIVQLEAGKIYTGTLAPVVWDYCSLDLNSSKIESTLGSGSVFGIRLGNYAEVKNGWHHVISTGTPSSQFIFHAPISLGAPNTNGDTVASPDPFGSVTGWAIRNMKLSGTRLGGPAIQGMGGFNNGIIENIEVPSNATNSGIHFDWGDVGGVSVAAGSGSGGAYVSDFERLTKWRAAFEAGTMYTIHPHDIAIRNVKVGLMACPQIGDTGSRIIRLSGCHGITAENLTADGVTLPAFEHVGGDFGYEFAPIATQVMAYRGTTVRNLLARQCAYHGIFVDTYADNVQNAVAGGYSARTSTIYSGGVTLENCTVYGLDVSIGDGLRVQECIGLVVKDCSFSLFAQGIGIEQKTENLTITGGRVWRNRGNGINIENSADIKSVLISRVEVALNGTGGASFCGVGIYGGVDHVVENCIVGGPGEDAQFYGILVGSSALRISVIGNKVREVKSGGFGFNLGSSSDYAILWVFRDNVHVGGNTARAGVNIVPIERILKADGTYSGRFRALKAALTSGDLMPSSGSWTAGDTILYENPTASGKIGTICVASGGPGTWKFMSGVDA